ncbi:hypothetical protein [Sphingomonas glaciei]|uniref:Transglutaminase domain-containing protein n=1 Tax=Sphingomonas glaciei TaxID=2938948 RepID=A0ABY5MXJ1_9SPHN|nr:hypothetical protein [Sphingomonas glaciei]UUR08475.1 hypothetical protein M1K48_02170 [Sphingomonas glaciei]
MTTLNSANPNATQLQKLDAADALLRKRFVHGYSYFRMKQNWMAAFLRPVWDDLAAPVRPDDILKFRRAACSQQAIVFQEIAKRLGFEFASVRINGQENLGGHFLPTIKIEGQWWVYDANQEIAARRYPLDWLMTADAQISNVYQPDVARLLLNSAHAKRVRFTDLNENAAEQASLLHGALALLSSVGWMLALLLWAILRPRPKQQNLPVEFPQPGKCAA